MRLVPYTDADLDLVAVLESDPAVMRNLGGTVGTDDIREIHRKRLAGIAADDWYFTVIPDGATGPVGIVGIWKTPWQGGTIDELGVMMRPGPRSHGFGMRALKAIIELARDAHRCDTVHAFTAVSNVQISTLGKRLGFRVIEQCELDYEGRPLRCDHWILDLTC